MEQERRTVAVLDDEPLTRMDLRDMLTEQGFDVVGEAADGFDAVELCREKHPDVVLMDVKMPVFDGLTASETILTENLADCVVLLTAFSDGGIVERAGQAGVTGYLVKPIDQKSLTPTIEVALAQGRRLRRARQEAEEAQEKIRRERQSYKAPQSVGRREQRSEAEAYRRLRRMAMDKRLSMADLASLERQLPLMAELTGADVFLDCITREGDAVVVAQARPGQGVSAYRQDACEWAKAVASIVLRCSR